MFYTQPEHLGDLIDHLSRDQGASRGRIGLLPPRTMNSMDENAILKEQFADASSPASVVGRRAGPPLPPNLSSTGRFPRDDTSGEGSYSLVRSLVPSVTVHCGVMKCRVARPVRPQQALLARPAARRTGSVEDRLQALLDKLSSERSGR